MPSTRFRVAGASINQTTVEDPGIENAMRGIAMLAASKRESRRMDIMEGQAGIRSDQARADNLWRMEKYAESIGGDETLGFEDRMRKYADLSPDMKDTVLAEETELKKQTDRLDRQERTLKKLADDDNPSSQESMQEIAAAQEAGESEEVIDRLIRSADRKATKQKNRLNDGMMELGKAQQWMEESIAEGRAFNPELIATVQEFQDQLESDASSGGSKMTDAQLKKHKSEIKKYQVDQETIDYIEEGASEEFLRELRDSMRGSGVVGEDGTVTSSGYSQAGLLHKANAEILDSYSGGVSEKEIAAGMDAGEGYVEPEGAAQGTETGAQGLVRGAIERGREAAKAAGWTGKAGEPIRWQVLSTQLKKDGDDTSRKAIVEDVAAIWQQAAQANPQTAGRVTEEYVVNTLGIEPDAGLLREIARSVTGDEERKTNTNKSYKRDTEEKKEPAKKKEAAKVETEEPAKEKAKPATDEDKKAAAKKRRDAKAKRDEDKLRKKGG